VVVTVVDNDKLTGGSEVGHMWMGVYEALEADGPSDEPHPAGIQLCRPLSPPESVEKGDILVSISFLPTSQRILIQVSLIIFKKSYANEAAHKN
jgi:hypothetical protein